MRIIRLQISVLLALLLATSSRSQEVYRLFIRYTDKDSVRMAAELGLQTRFDNRIACSEYCARVPDLLRAKGYITASVDSLQFDSLSARMVLFAGEKYQWASLGITGLEPEELQSLGWEEQFSAGNIFDYSLIQGWQEKILVRMENNGYPFARVSFDSISLDSGQVSGRLKVDKGPLYKIDSLRVFGTVKLSNLYLQRYLDIPNGSLYSREKLAAVNRKIRELPYIEEERPFDITLLGTGSVLNLYLKQKKSSQVNLLVGFLPNNNQLAGNKLLLTGEANILLRNALGAGEMMGLNWQQLQVRSPRLNILYQHPYIFRSPFGLDFAFDMFRKDSSFVNVNTELGARYVLNKNQSGKLFIQRFQTIVSEGGIDSAFVIRNRRLPDVGDLRQFNMGLDYEFANTDYRPNPRKGYDLRLTAAAGTRKLKKNNSILGLKDPNDPGFDFNRLYDTVKLNTWVIKLRVQAARFFPLAGKRSTVKTAVQAGWIESESLFRNELFQLGGYKTLRGFDEESQYLSRFAIATVEYRYLVGQNSYFYVLADGGWGENRALQPVVSYRYFGTGLGLAFETKAGIFNLAWAVGKRSDTEFNLRQSKIHFGFLNYF